MYNPTALYGHRGGASNHSETSWEEETVKSSVIHDEASYLEESFVGEEESFAEEEETVDGSKVGSSREQQEAARIASQKAQARKVFVKAAQLAAEGGSKGGNLNKKEGVDKTIEKECKSSAGISHVGEFGTSESSVIQGVSTNDSSSIAKEKAKSRRLKAKEELARLNQQLAQQTIKDNLSAVGDREEGANTNVNGALGPLTLK